MPLFSATNRDRIFRGLLDWLALTLCQASLIAGLAVAMGYCGQLLQPSLSSAAVYLIVPSGLLVGLCLVIAGRNQVWLYVLSILCGLGVVALCLLALYNSEQSLFGFWIVATGLGIIAGVSLALAAIAAGILLLFRRMNDQARIIARNGAVALCVVFAIAAVAGSAIAHRPTEESLIRAVLKGETPTAERLLVRGISANTVKTWQPWGGKDRVPENSVLGLAAFRGDDAMAKLLLSHGANPNRMPVNDHSALYDAACSGKITTVKLLLAAGADATGSSGIKAMGAAASNGNVEMMELLIVAGSPLDETADDRTPLVRAAAVGHLAAIRYLIGRGAKRSLEDGTALIAATQHGHIAAADFLIDAGTSLEQHGDAALAAAIPSFGHDVVRHLIQRGARAKRNGKAHTIAKSLYNKHESEVAWVRTNRPEGLRSQEAIARQTKEILESVEKVLSEGE